MGLLEDLILRRIFAENPAAGFGASIVLQILKQYEAAIQELRLANAGLVHFLHSIKTEVHGLTELDRDFHRASISVKRDLGKALREAAQPVRAEAAAIAAQRWPGRTAAGYRVYGGLRGNTGRPALSVAQSLRKTTGRHPGFGGLQVRQALEPALAHNKDKVFRSVEESLNKTLRAHGL